MHGSATGKGGSACGFWDFPSPSSLLQEMGSRTRLQKFGKNHWHRRGRRLIGKKIKVVCTHSISGGIDSTLIEGWVQEKSIRWEINRWRRNGKCNHYGPLRNLFSKPAPKVMVMETSQARLRWRLGLDGVFEKARAPFDKSRAYILCNFLKCLH